MNAEHLLDSLRFRDAVNKLANTWRNKKAKDVDKVAALQAFLDLLEVKPTRPIVPEPTGPQPAPLPEVNQSTGPQDISSLSPEDRARIFDIDLPPLPPKLSQEAVHQANQEAFQAKREQALNLLPNIPLGKKAAIVLPPDFPVRDLPAYLNGTGFGVTEKEPVNLEIAAKLAGGHFDAATGIGGKKVVSGPKIGWQVELIKVG